MKKHILILGFIIIANIVVIGQTKKILFLGNSYTAVNNLPEKVSLLASSLGDSVYFDSNTPGGYRLVNHVTNSTTLSKISQKEWDFVVIQAQSQEPSWPPSQVATEVLPYASILNDSIKSSNACTETVFYMTWGRKYGDQQNCSSWPPVCTYLGMQERLMTGYMTMAEENGSTVAPVGLAWKNTMDNDPDSLINLYSGDNSHPSLAGTYLTACVMYATMFQKSPVGANYFAGLSEYDATFLQQMAEDVVLSDTYNFTFYDTYTSINYDLGWQNWFDFGNITFADFSAIGMGATYNFIDNSLNAQDYHWDFGDGNTSTLQNPSHEYFESGEYIITQSVNNICFENSAFDTINVVIDQIEENNFDPVITINPNPGKGIFFISITSKAKTDNVDLLIFDAFGKIVKKDLLDFNNGHGEKQIDLSNLKKGIYFLKTIINEENVCQKIVIQ